MPATPDDLLFEPAAIYDPSQRRLTARVVEAVLDSTAPFLTDPRSSILISAPLLAAICEVARRHLPHE